MSRIIHISSFLILSFISISLSGQKLGPHLVSTSGQSYANGEIMLYASIGEPINTSESSGEGTISQGVLQSIFQTGVQGIENCTTEQGRMFYQDCDDGTEFFFIEDKDGRILDPYYGEGVSFEDKNGITVEFGYTIADFKSPCSIADEAVILTCVSEVLSTSTTNVLSNDIVSLYPNPTDDQVYFQSNSIQLENARVKIFNNIGTDVTSKTRLNIQNKSVEVTNLQNGFYVLQFSTEEGVINKGIIIRR